MAARLLEFSNRFKAYNFHPIELKLGKMLLYISPHHRSEPTSPISVHGAMLQTSNRFTDYSSYAIELKLGGMILDISLHNRLESTPTFCRRHPCMFLRLAVAEIAIFSI